MKKLKQYLLQKKTVPSSFDSTAQHYYRLMSNISYRIFKSCYVIVCDSDDTFTK